MKAWKLGILVPVMVVTSPIWLTGLFAFTAVAILIGLIEEPRFWKWEIDL